MRKNRKGNTVLNQFLQKEIWVPLNTFIGSVSTLTKGLDKVYEKLNKIKVFKQNPTREKYCNPHFSLPNNSLWVVVDWDSAMLTVLNDFKDRNTKMLLSKNDGFL